MPAEQRKTILVVDDEPEIRKLIAAIISQCGYQALTADSGEHAMTMCRNWNVPLEMLITDVIVPGMSGPMLAEELAAMQPGLKVLYISGYADSHVVQKYVVERGHALLTKPFTLEALRSKMLELLPVTACATA
jgi:CheY-like chemotaxis protein